MAGPENIKTLHINSLVITLLLQDPAVCLLGQRFSKSVSTKYTIKTVY